MIYRRWLIGIFLLLVIVPLPQAARAEEDDFPQVTLEASWQGYVRYAGWTEVLVTVSNPATAWEGNLRVANDVEKSVFLMPLSLAPNAHKQYRVPLYVDSGTGLTWSLERADGARQALSLTLHGVAMDERACAFVGDVAALPKSLLADCAVKVALADATALPETAMAWDTMDLVFLNGAATEGLSEQQRQAMLAWVTAGGRLVLSGGGTLPQTLAGLPRQLRVATMPATHVVSHFGGQSEMVVAQLQPSDAAQVLLRQDAYPIAVQQAVGYGLVDVLGWDLAQGGNSDAVTSLWAGDRIPAAGFVATDMTISNAARLSPGELLSFPLKKVPKKLAWLCLFPLYLGLMGPLTPLIAKRFHHPLSSWGLLFLWIGLSLLIVMLFLSGIFSHTFPLVHESAIVYSTGAGLPARVVQGTAIYAPRAPAVEWSSGGLPRAMRGSFAFNDTWRDGEAFPITVRLGPQATMRTRWPSGVVTWGTEGLIPSSEMRADFNFAAPNGTLALTGQISSSLSLRDAALMIYAPKRTYRVAIGDIAASQSPLAVSEVLTDGPEVLGMWERALCAVDINSPGGMPFPMVSPESEKRKENQQQSRCYLTAYADFVPFPVQGLKGTHSEHSCMIYPVTCPAQANVASPVRLVGEESNDAYGGTDEEGNIYLSGAQAVEFDYTAPEYLQVQHIDALTLTFRSVVWQAANVPFNPAAHLANVNLWDWRTRKWVDLTPLPADKTPFVLRGADAARFFDPRNGMRVKIKPRKGENVAFRLNVEVHNRP